MKREVLPPKHSSIATGCLNIGLTYFRAGRYSEALPYMKEANEIAKASLPPGHRMRSVSEDYLSLLANLTG